MKTTEFTIRAQLGTLAFGLVTLIVPGCLYDEDKSCGDEMIFDGIIGCVCPPGTVKTDKGGCDETTPGSGGAGGGSGGEGGMGGDASGSGGNSSGGEEIGKSCESDADCSGLENGYCDTFKGWCTMKDCSFENDECPDGWECCDLSAFGMSIMCVSLAEGGCTE